MKASDIHLVTQNSVEYLRCRLSEANNAARMSADKEADIDDERSMH